jgi:hypothetical protein
VAKYFVDEVILVGRIIALLSLLGSSNVVTKLVDSLDFQPATWTKCLADEMIKGNIELGLLEAPENGSIASTPDTIFNNNPIPSDKLRNLDRLELMSIACHHSKFNGISVTEAGHIRVEGHARIIVILAGVTDRQQ